MTEFDEWKAEQAAKWLRHIRELKHDIARLEDDIEVQRSLALPSGIDYSMPSVSKSPSPDAIPNAVVRLQDAIAEYATELVGYLDEKDEARMCIGMLDDARHRAVLSLYYVNGHSWVTVSKVMHYEVSWCKRLRNEALPLMYDHMPRQWRTMVPPAL